MDTRDVSTALLSRVFLWCAVAFGVGCGGSVATAPMADGRSRVEAQNGAVGADGGVSNGGMAGTEPRAARPFAGSAAEATQLIGAAVDEKSVEIQRCVAEYRKRKNLLRERVSIQFGIDQEGRLLGATLPAGKADARLEACAQTALTDARFPRSHTGVISMTKSYEEIAQ